MRNLKSTNLFKNVADNIILLMLSVFALVTIYPFYNVVILSLAKYQDIIKHPLYLIPYSVDFTSYKMIFKDTTIVYAVMVSIFITVTGTFCSLLFTALAAYALSKKNLPGRRIILSMVIFTMYFSGGLIPWYLTCKAVGMVNSLASMIIPSLISTFYFILMKNYFSSLPESIEESGKIDGANDFYILFRIIIPISAPIMATIGLFYAVDYWNQWYNAMIFINDSHKLPLQIILRKVVVEATLELGNNMADSIRNSKVQNYPRGIQMATVIVTCVPIIIVYPFIQKYFTKGIMLGAIKA